MLEILRCDEMLNPVSWYTITRIVKEELELRKVTTWWVLRHLMQQHKQQ